MDQETDVKQCKVELLSDEVLGWVFKPGPGCDEVLAKISDKQGPHAQHYLNVRKREQTQESTDENDKPI